MLECAVLPFHAGSEQDTSKEEWVVGESRGDMTLCFDEEMSRAW